MDIIRIPSLKSLAYHRNTRTSPRKWVGLSPHETEIHPSPKNDGIEVSDQQMPTLSLGMDKELFQTALRVLQQINKRLPVAPADANRIRDAAPPELAGLGIDQIAVELIQRQLKRKP